MEKSLQTEELKVRVYNLTLSFVRKYQPEIYKQSREAHEDLAMAYWMSFMTEKSREKGKEASLLDKFDDRITTLEYLLKIAVRNKLIDSSRSCKKHFSIDQFTEEYGDFFAERFGLVAEIGEETVDSREFTKDEISDLKSRFQKLTIEAQKTLRRQFKEAKCALNPSYQDVLTEILAY